MITTVYLILLYALVIPYIGLMLMVVVGLFRRNERQWVQNSPDVPEPPPPLDPR